MWNWMRWTFKWRTSIFSSYDKCRIFVPESGNVLKYANITNLEDMFRILEFSLWRTTGLDKTYYNISENHGINS